MPTEDHQRQSRATGWFQTPEARSVLVSGWPHLIRACDTRPNMPVWVVSALGRPAAFGELPLHQGVWLTAWQGGYCGDATCTHPWPLPNESVGTLLLHHVTDCRVERSALLEDSYRVLVPGGQLFLFAMNPLSPMRRFWWRAGISASEPSSLRRALRTQGFHCDTSTMGYGPIWTADPDDRTSRGAGPRAAYMMHAEKRTIPLSPVRARPARTVTVPGLAK